MEEKIFQAVIECKKQNPWMNSWGIRTDYNDYKVGDNLPASHDWDFDTDNPSDEYLPGTCATGFDGMMWWDEEDPQDDLELIRKALALNAEYPGTHQYLIGGRASGNGYENDNGEIIIEDAEVIMIIK